jgi:pyrroline-5-carboxylate reductase
VSHNDQNARSALLTRRVGFLGCGAMARALAGGLRAAGLPGDRISGSDPDASQRGAFEQATQAHTSSDNRKTVSESDVVVIAVKPQVVASVLGELSGASDLERPLWISIAAGVSLASLERALSARSRIVRSMPNTPALVQAGATAICANRSASADDLALASALFNAVGITWTAPREELLDAVTGLSGSGPAYVFVLLEALADAGVRQGLPRDAAHRLACQTVLGAAKLALESGVHPAALKDQVSSPGGTTIAGLERLEAGGVRAAIHQAVAAATARSKELGQ